MILSFIAIAMMAVSMLGVLICGALSAHRSIITDPGVILFIIVGAGGVALKAYLVA